MSALNASVESICSGDIKEHSSVGVSGELSVAPVSLMTLFLFNGNSSNVHL